MNTIPFVDLNKQYLNIKNDLDPKIQEVIDSHDFIQGSFVTEFESIFSKLHQTKHVIGCSNGTAAISVALKALDIKKGDEVITTPHTFIATVEAICHVGATPVFADINQKSYNIDPEEIEKKITKKTKAILPVHLYGNPCQMDQIMKISKENNLLVIEDCAQAHLAQYKGKYVGNFGKIGAFSFYPGKNLGAYGDAGAIITNSNRLSEKCRMLIDHGRLDKYSHKVIGDNNRMDCLQAAVLTVKSKYIKKWTVQRQKNALIYNRFLTGISDIITPDAQNSVFHLYVIQAKKRDELLKYLKSKNISVGIHYPIPLHLQPALKYLGYKKGDFPVTEKIAKNILSLPIYPEMEENQIAFVYKTIKDYYK